MHAGAYSPSKVGRAILPAAGFQPALRAAYSQPLSLLSNPADRETKQKKLKIIVAPSRTVTLTNGGAGAFPCQPAGDRETKRKKLKITVAPSRIVTPMNAGASAFACQPAANRETKRKKLKIAVAPSRTITPTKGWPHRQRRQPL